MTATATEHHRQEAQSMRQRAEREAVSAVAPTPTAQTVAKSAAPLNSKTLACDLCDFVSEAKKKATRTNSLYRHKQTQHPESLKA